MDYPYVADIDGLGKIHFKAWTTKLEKQFLLSKTENTTENEVLELLIKPSLEEKSLYDELTYFQKIMIMVEIRKVSIGEEFSINYVCSECGQPNTVEANISDMIHYAPSKKETIEHQSYKITFCDEKKSLLKYKESQKTKESIIEMNFVSFVISIDEIWINGKVEKGYSYQELYDKIEAMPSKVFDFFYSKFIERSEKFELTLKTTCYTCNHVANTKIDDISGFLWEG